MRAQIALPFARSRSWAIPRLRAILGLRAILASLLVVALGPIPVRQAQAYPYYPVASQPGFGKGVVLPGAKVEYGSPVVADLDKDGKMEIVVGAADGKIHAVRPDGTLMWVFDVTTAINALSPQPGQGHIDSVPAVGDLDNDGWPEVVVSAGSPSSVVGYNGGMVVLSYDGRLRPGWPQVGADQIGPGMGGPDGWLEGFYSSPALADLDGDGDLEIVVGGWDMRFYAWHHDGRLVTGWPRFASDTVWSSPAIADLDKDGRPEVIIGRDAATGGFLEVLRWDGSKQPGFPKPIDQTIFSSPAIADLNGDGRLDIVVGTGNYFSGRGMAVYAWDASGNLLPGWPAATGGYTLSAPAVGDLDGDGDPEVVIGANDGKAYAFHGNGQPVAGWPAQVQDNFGNQAALNYASPVLANFDKDPQPEVFINHFCDTVVIDGNGALLTHVGSSGASGKPSMYMFNAWCLGTTPAVADLEGDGKLEVVRAGGTYDPNTKTVGNGLIYVWEINGAPAFAPWPMFRRDSEHRSTFEPEKAFDARLVNQSLPSMLASGGSQRARVTYQNTGTQTWTAASGIALQAAADNTLTPGRRIGLEPGESIAPGQSKTFEFEIESAGQAGYTMSSWRLADGSGQVFGSSAWRETKVGSGPAYYVLSRTPNGGQGGVYAGGVASQISVPKDYWNWPQVKDLVVTSDKQGYQLLDYQGGVWQGGTAPSVGGHGFVNDAVELLMRNDQSSYYYILDRYGRLTRSGGAPDITPAPPVQGAPAVRSGTLTPDGKGVYVLAGNGAILSGGNAPALSGSPGLGADIAKKIRLAPGGRGAYVLDAYGRVWPVGGAPSISPNYALHLNEDWARDIEITEDGRGYYLLDREGGIHTGGVAPSLGYNPTPTWPGQDVAVALVVTDSRAAPALVTSPKEVQVLTTPSLPQSIKLAVGTSDQAQASWRAESDAGWAKVQTASGQTPGTLAVNVQPGAMAPGVYSATIQVVDPNGVYPSSTVTVRLRVVSELYKTSVPLIMK